MVYRLKARQKNGISDEEFLKIISGGQTGVDRGALDAALAFEVECGGWCPAGRLAEDGTIPEHYPVVELANAGYAERTARNVADSDGTLVISKGELCGGTRETIDCCVEMGKPYLVIDRETALDGGCDRAGIAVRLRLCHPEHRQGTSPNTTTQRDVRDVPRSRAGLALSAQLGMMVLNVAGPRASQWPEGHKTAQRIVSGILRRLVDRTAPLNTVRDSPRGDP